VRNADAKANLVPERGHAKLLQVLSRQAGQNRFVNLVLAECSLVFSKAKATKGIGFASLTNALCRCLPKCAWPLGSHPRNDASNQAGGSACRVNTGENRPNQEAEGCLRRV